MSSSKPITKFGIIGDIHAEPEFLHEAISFLRGNGLDVILCVGDVPDGPGSVDTCCEILQREAIITVSGNHDRWLLNNERRSLTAASDLALVSSRSHTFLESLPPIRWLKTVNGLLLLCHGLGMNDMATLSPDDHGYGIEKNEDLQQLIQSALYRFVVNGHTHYKMVRHFGGLTIINAGSLCRGHNPGFLKADLEKGYLQFYEFNKGHSVVEAEQYYLPSLG